MDVGDNSLIGKALLNSRVNPHARCQNATDARRELADTGKQNYRSPQLVAFEHHDHDEVDETETGMSNRYNMKVPATILYG